MKPIIMLLLVFSLAFTGACANTVKKTPKVKVEQPDKSSFVEAAKQPIYSANLIRKEVPEYLKNINQSYKAPQSCVQYQEELLLLNDALGEDPIDQANDDDKVITLHFGKLVSRGVESSIPLNGLVKTISGAKKHERKVLAARLKGNARRSYLKGWAAAMNCEQK